MEQPFLWAIIQIENPAIFHWLKGIFICLGAVGLGMGVAFNGYEDGKKKATIGWLVCAAGFMLMHLFGINLS